MEPDIGEASACAIPLHQGPLQRVAGVADVLDLLREIDGQHLAVFLQAAQRFLQALGVRLYDSRQRRTVPFLLGADRGADIVRRIASFQQQGRGQPLQRLRQIVPQLL